MTGIRERLLEAFHIEYREHLKAIRGLLGELARQGEGSGIAQLDETFRHAHSLKGAARAVDLPPVERMSHRLETLFARIRSGEIPLSPEVAGLIGRVLDAIEDWVAANSAGAASSEPEGVMAEMEAVLEGRPLPDAAAASAPPSSPPPVLSAAPSPPEAVAPPRSDDTVRVRARHLDRLLRTSNELVTETMIQRGLTRSLVAADRRLSEMERHWRRLRQTVGGLVRRVGDHEDSLQLGRQMDAVEQTLRHLVAEARATRRTQRRTAWTLRQLGADLQQEVRDARMVSADSIFGGFRKMVRDLARDKGKQVEVLVAGLEVEADRMALQGLKDPVMHLLRNALSHGVESPQRRTAAGKPPIARIALRFEVSDGRLVVLVEDDGRGIDYEAVRRKAVERGMMGHDEAHGLGRDALLDLIFHPGFSTAREVDELSGRGVGLSVVRESCAMMNGVVEVRSFDPAGTCFRLSVPLSVSSQRLFLVECQGHVYALPTEGIDRLYRAQAEDVATVEGKSVIYLGGQQMSLLSLAHLLALGESAVTVSRNLIPLVVLRNGERRVAVAVDGFLSIREGLVKDIGVPGTRGTMVAGGMLLEDGGIALVLNPFEIVETFRKSGGIRVLTTVEKPAERHAPVILVVDDSLTTRTLEKSILEAHGYQVRLAFDGLEALVRLRAEPIDLIISDIQMPRLDGFGLLQAVKADAVLKSVPVILVSSLEAREDRERGLELGADAYVVKRKFDQKELLETIGQFL